MEVWLKRLSNWRNWVVIILVAISLYQANFEIGGYGLIWLKRAWKNLGSTSMERSALYYFGDTGSSFMEFIGSNVPLDMNVIVPGKLTQFASQSILQYYLFPRAVLSCPCDSPTDACRVCLQDPASFIPAIKKFPPIDALDHTKQFVPFVSSSPSYFGIYIPSGIKPDSQPQAANPAPYHLILAFLIDLCVLGCLGFLGFSMARLVLPGLAWVEALSLSVPLGLGLLTFVIFLTSWLGLPIVLPTIILIYILEVAGLLVYRRLMKSSEADAHKAPIKFHMPDLSEINWVDAFAWGLIGCLFLIMTVISVNRSYSQFDDIAIWSLKGYGIAYKGTIFASDYLGGHGLAYPLNLPLSITVFKLASGDLLPGSKFLFPILSAAVLFGCYRFLRRWGVNSALAWTGIFLLITSPEIFLHSTLGFANVPFAAYLVLGVLWSVEGLLHEQPRSLFMGGLLLAFAAWTRPEGIVFAGILMAVLFCARLIAVRKLYFSPAWVAPFLVPVIWLLFAVRYVAGDQAGGALSQIARDLANGSLSLTPLKMMIDYARSTAVSPAAWGYIFPVSAVMLVVAVYRLLPRVNPPAFLLLPAAIMAVLVPAGLFFVESTTEPDFVTFLTVSFNRAYLPAAFLIVTLGLLTLGTLGARKEVDLDKSDENA
jgi:hypothetical protein